MEIGAQEPAQEAFNRAVTSAARNLLVIAPPGCGKTELLARRAECLIESLFPHQRILALTFSNKARANLNARLVNVLGVERKRRYVTVRNFHGHAAEVLRAHARTLGMDPSIEMPEKRTQSSVVAPYLDDLTDAEAGGLRERIETELRTPKQRPYADAQVLAWLESNGSRQSLEIEVARQDAGTPFYDDLLRHAQRLLRVPEVAQLYRHHYGAVLVDEFQDLSPQQLDLAMRSCDQSRTFVGDPLQGIYTWNGARPVQVERQLRRICGEPEGLGVSHRSSPRVLTLLNTVSVALGGQRLEPNDPESWYDGGIAAGIVSRTGVEEAEFIEDVARRILERRPDSTIGVICRSGWRRKTVDQVFSSSDLPSYRWDLAVDDARIVDMLRDAAARLGDDYDLDALRDEVLSKVDAADADTISDVSDAIQQLTEMAAGAGSVGSALAQLRDPDDGETAIAAGVHLLNAHIGKGQQFDWVFIPGLEQGHIPSFLAKPSELAEEQRVLLVMLSRARHGAVLTRADTLVSKKGNTYPTKPCPWTEQLRAGLSSGRDGLIAHVAELPAT